MGDMEILDMILYACYVIIAFQSSKAIWNKIKKTVMVKLEQETLEILGKNKVFKFVRDFIKTNNKEGIPLVSLSFENNASVSKDFEFLAKKNAVAFYTLETVVKDRGTVKYAFLFIDSNSILYLLETHVKKVVYGNDVYTNYILKDIMIFEKEDIVPLRKAQIERVLYLEDEYGSANRELLTKSIVSIKNKELSLYLIWNKDNNVELKYKFENIHVDGILIDERE